MNNTSPKEVVTYVIGTPFNHLPASGITLRQIGPNGEIVTTRVTKSGLKFALITDRYGFTDRVPREICGMTAGKDAWLRGILFRCADCKTRHRADELEAADVCPACLEKVYRENAELNGETYP